MSRAPPRRAHPKEAFTVRSFGFSHPQGGFIVRSPMISSSRTRSDTSGQPQSRPFCPLRSARPCMPIKSRTLTSPCTSFPPMLAHERATSTLLTVVALSSRNFSTLFTVYSAFANFDDKPHHHPWGAQRACLIAPCLPRLIPSLIPEVRNTQSSFSRLLVYGGTLTKANGSLALND